MKLTKREIVLLSLLLFVAIVFGGYRFVLTPLQARYLALQQELSSAKNEKDMIDLSIQTLPSIEKKKTEALQGIDRSITPFFSGIPTEALLLYLHDTILASGLIEGNYGISPDQAIRIVPLDRETAALSYPIGELANQYRALDSASSGGSNEPTPSPSPAQTPEVLQDRTLVQWTTDLALSGTYEQCKDFLSRIEMLDRTLIVQRLVISSTQEGDNAPSLFNFTVQISFFGIDKIVPQEDAFTTWTRPDVTGKPDPFK